jgi:hypothetical protein
MTMLANAWRTWWAGRPRGAEAGALPPSLSGPSLSDPSLSGPVLSGADVIVSHIEVCDRHGVGRLLQMLFDGHPNILSIRSANFHAGAQEFGAHHLCISHAATSRDAVRATVASALGATTVARVLCVPYFADDVRTALALHDIFGAPLCTYIMDDQNVHASGISDDLMRELLTKSQVRLAISPEMASVYGEKYGLAMGYMPPLAPRRMIPDHLVPPPERADSRHGICIGNIWGQRWVELLRNTVRGSGETLTWYCNGEFRWLPCGRHDLIADSIIPRDPLPEPMLVDALRNHVYAVVPSGTLDASDDRRFIARLSLPSRIPYMMATAQIPIIVLGSRETGASRFVEQFGIGVTAGYDTASFSEAVNYITQPDVNLSMRQRAYAVAGQFADAGAAEWIWQSLATGRPYDRRYEDLILTREPDPSGLAADAKF